MYAVTTETTNGYRCSCCRHSDWHTEWYDTLEGALEELPTEMRSSAHYEVVEVEVKDGNSGEVVAWGKMDWSSGYGRYSGYKYTRWHGHRPDTGDFEQIKDQQGKVVDKTWVEIRAGLAKERAQKELEEAKRKMEEAQRDMARAEKMLEQDTGG